LSAQSPKFPQRKKELEQRFSIQSIKDCWKHKVRTNLKRSIISDPFEWLDYHTEISSIAEQVRKSVLDGGYSPTSTAKVSLEKSKRLCRQLVIPEPRDALVLQILSDALYSDIKATAPTNKAFFEPKDHSFSPNKNDSIGASGHGSFAAWLKFQKTIFKFADEYEYIVVTDVANFFDFIRHDHLRNIISEKISVPESVIDVLIYTLNGMSWLPDYMPSSGVGLPQMDADAPRLLAHCFLYEVDQFLSDNNQCDFTRFMDDIDIGVRSISDAKVIIRDVDLILQTRQVRLNSGKTKILNKEQAYEYFRIRENKFIESLNKRIGRKLKAGKDFKTDISKIKKYILKANREGRFDSGSGEKILKRLISALSTMGGQIDEKTLIKFVLLRPAIRDVALRHRAKFKLNLKFISGVKHIVLKDQFVDDASFHYIANCLCACPSRRDKRIAKGALEIAEYISTKGTHGLIASLQIFSRFGSEEELWKHIYKNRNKITNSHYLGRVFGSLIPYFFSQEKNEKYIELITDSGSLSAKQALEFSRSLQNNNHSAQAIMKFLKAKNPTFALEITHAKFGMALSVLRNEDTNTKDKNILIKTFGTAFSDYYYKRQIDKVVF